MSKWVPIKWVDDMHLDEYYRDYYPFTTRPNGETKTLGDMVNDFFCDNIKWSDVQINTISVSEVVRVVEEYQFDDSDPSSQLEKVLNETSGIEEGYFERIKISKFYVI